MTAVNKNVFLCQIFLVAGQVLVAGAGSIGM
jgi:hypothetical protein